MSSVVAPTPLCPNPAHRARGLDYAGDGGRPICGVCHPRPQATGNGRPSQPRLVPVAEFGATAEPGAEPILGEGAEVLIGEGTDVMLHGPAGAGKTTLELDAAFHLAAGDPWLGIPVPRPVRVAVAEAEGPRPLFRGKADRLATSWSGSDLGDRLVVLEEPWAQFSFGDLAIAAALGLAEVEVLIVGPVSALGMVGNGTLAEVRAFMAEVAAFRRSSGRPLAVVLIHHDNNAGSASGAWEGAVDTLVAVESPRVGRTGLWFEKARWAPRWHRRRLALAWTEDERFALADDDERDLIAAVEAYVRENPLSSTGDVEAGVDARAADVRAVLKAHHGTRFRLITGDAAVAAGRSAKANLWEVVDGEG